MRRDSMGAIWRKLNLRHPAFSAGVSVLAVAAALALSACGGGQPSAPRPAAASSKAAAPAASGGTNDQGGSGSQILTSDLLQRQEVRADKLIANWAIVGNTAIQSITVNGQPQTFATGDTVSFTKEFILKIAQTVVTIAAVDARGEKRELSYLIVNPGLPIKEPEIIQAPTKIAETKEEQKKQAVEIEQQEQAIKAKFSEGEYSAWFYVGPLNQVYNREVRRGMYPVWMDSRLSSGAQYRMVFKPLPSDVLTHRAYWGLTPQQYNDLVDDLSARGYQQVFREVLQSSNEQWRVQTVWVLKVKGK